MPKSSGAKTGVIWRTGAGIAIVGGITMVGFRVLPVNAITEGFCYLIAILFLATAWGLTEAVVASVFAVLCFNYFFLPPLETFTIEDPQNWIALFAFLITAITASRLSAQSKRRALEVLAKQEEIERLYALSRGMLLLEPSQPAAKQVAQQIAQAFDAPSVVLYSRYDQTYHQAGPEDFPGLNEQLQKASLEGTQFRSEQTWISAIRLGGEPIGSLGISGVDLSDSVVQSLTNLAAIGLERSRAQDLVTKAEVARQSDELKSTLLDAIAHEFQTPLTTIKAVTSSLLAARTPNPAHQAEMLRMVDDEAERLSGLVSDAIQMARIEAGTLRLERVHMLAATLIQDVLRQKQSILAERRFTVEVPPDLYLWIDPELIALALRQLIDNAAKYSDANLPIGISAKGEEEQVSLAVQDRGQGIPEADLPHIFDKFYRGRQSRSQISGAGLGLGVARAVVAAHGGRIWAESRVGEGTVVRIALPFEKEAS